MHKGCEERKGDGALERETGVGGRGEERKGTTPLLPSVQTLNRCLLVWRLSAGAREIGERDNGNADKVATV